jgi:hypothetical protein
MRQVRPFFLSGITAIALMVAATMAQASVSKNLGMFRQQDTWDVGAVRTAGASYCAMISRFDKNVALAFARNPRGYSSVAVDFQEDFFRAGSSYEVALQVNNGKAQRLIGRASTARSIIVQTGTDEGLYNALAGNGNLRIWMPAMNASFGLDRFYTSYAALMDCAARLQQPHQGPPTVAMPVKPVEKYTLALKSKQQQPAMSAARVEAPSPVTQERKIAVEENHNADDVKDQLETLKRQKDDLAAKLEDQDRRNKTLEAALAAKDQELDSVKALAAEDKQALASLRTDFAGLKLERSAELEKLQSALADKTAQYDGLQKQLTDIQGQRQAVSDNTAQMEQDLALSRRNLAELQSQLTFAQQEKAAMATELGTQDRQNKSLLGKVSAQLDQARQQASLMESQMMSVALQKDELASQLDAQSRKNRLLQAALDAKDKELSLLRTASMERNKGVAALEPAAGDGGFYGSEGNRPAVTSHIIVRKAPPRPSRFAPDSGNTKNDWDTVLVQ